MADTMTAAAPSKRYRTMVLLLLTLVYGFNFIDRQIVGILAPFIQADLGLTNTELGLLIGLAFAAFYTVMGIPLAYLADRMNRVTLLSIALATWSGFTALTGYAQNFLHIALARVGVGVGEAGGSPSSHSMISDFYAKEERAGALGVYSLGIPFGIMAAYFFTAAIIPAQDGPVLEVNWRTIFIILGVTGTLLAGVVKLVIREPERGATEAAPQAKTSPYVSLGTGMKSVDMTPRWIIFGLLAAMLVASQVFGWMGWVFAVPCAIFLVMAFWLSVQPGVKVLAGIPSWWFMCFGIAFASFAAYAFSGFQTKFIRLLDPEFDFRKVIIALGFINGLAYAGGTYLGAKVVDMRAKRDVRAYGYVTAFATAMALPFGVAAFWVDTVPLHLALGTVMQFFIGWYLGPSFALAQTLAPVKIRAMSTALFFFILNLIALGGGPTIAGILIDVFGESGMTEFEATRASMTAVCASFVVAVIAYLAVTRTLPKDWADAEARNAAA